jgi:hypothetical protein
MKVLALIASNPSHWEMFWRAAVFLDKLLKGTTPADLSMERPHKTIETL